MRALIASILALALSTTSLAAAEVGPLSPGKPAGVKKADLGVPVGVVVVVGLVAIIAIAVASSGGGTNATATGTAT